MPGADACHFNHGLDSAKFEHLHQIVHAETVELKETSKLGVVRQLQVILFEARIVGLQPFQVILWIEVDTSAFARLMASARVRVA
jgi:hypothetical protein